MSMQMEELEMLHDKALTQRFWSGFFSGASVAAFVVLVICMLYSYPSDKPAEGRLKDKDTIGGYGIEGSRYPCSKTFVVLDCYYRNHRLYQVEQQATPEEQSRRLRFISDNHCIKRQTVLQHNEYEPEDDGVHDEGAIRIRPGFDVYDCKQFGDVYLFDQFVDFPK